MLSERPCALCAVVFEPEEQSHIVSAFVYRWLKKNSATGYIYTYGLMEHQRYAAQMQHEMMREIEAVRPKYLVFVAVTTSWLKRSNSKTEIFDWFDGYSAADFQLDGLVNIVSSEQTDYYLPLLVDPRSIPAFGILPSDLQTKNVAMLGGRARTSCYGFHPVMTKTARFSDGLTQFVEGGITTAERWQ